MITNVINAAGNYNASYEFYDAQLLCARNRPLAIGGGRTITDTFYNSVGETERTSGPYFNGDSGPATTLFPRPIDSNVPSQTVSAYDGDGRELSTSTLSLGNTLWQTSTTYGGDHTDVTPSRVALQHRPSPTPSATPLRRGSIRVQHRPGRSTTPRRRTTTKRASVRR